MNLALSRAARAAQRSLAIETQIEHRRILAWRRRRSGDGASIEDYLPLIEALPRMSAPRSRCRSPRAHRVARSSDGGKDPGPGGDGDGAMP
jgi:hypothetical protein